MAFQRREWRDNWPSLAAATVGVATGAAAFTYTAGLFVKPIQAATGWDRAEIATGSTIYSVIISLMMPLTGILVDRFGPRTVGSIGLAGFGLSLVTLSMLPASLPMYFAVLGLTALFAAATSAVVFAPVVVADFVRWRGLALGILMSGTSIALIPLAPLLQELIAAEGWQAGYRAVGFAALFAGLPLILLVLRKPVPVHKAAAIAPPSGLPMAQILRTSVFWRLVAGTALAAIPLGGFINQLPAFFSDKGVSPGGIAMLTSVLLGVIAAGRTLAGFLFDWLSPPLVACGLLGGAAAAAFLLNSGSAHVDYYLPLVALIGISFGAEAEIHAFFAARQFGRRAFATTFGLIVMMVSASLGAGALLFASIQRATGSYALALDLAAGSLVCAAVLFLTMPKAFEED